MIVRRGELGAGKNVRTEHDCGIYGLSTQKIVKFLLNLRFGNLQEYVQSHNLRLQS
jgi:hypothetical protein